MLVKPLLPISTYQITSDRKTDEPCQKPKCGTSSLFKVISQINPVQLTNTLTVIVKLFGRNSKLANPVNNLCIRMTGHDFD